MTKQEQEFLEKNFKAGEYCQLTILVKNEDLTKIIEHLKKANLNLAIIPSAQAKMDFADPNHKGTPV